MLLQPVLIIIHSYGSKKSPKYVFTIAIPALKNPILETAIGS
jgi:hypothetical protein